MSERQVANSFNKPFTTNVGGYGTTPYGVSSSDLEMLYHLRMINTNTNYTQQQMQEYLDITEKRIQAATRKQRRCRINQIVVTQENGEIILVDVYNDGYREARQFILNICGNWKIYRLVFSKTVQQTEKFAIAFITNGVWVIGNVNKNSGKNLYEYFVKAGIVFNPEIRRTQIQEALFAHFSPLIENSVDRLELPELGGWNGNRFLYAENFLYLKRQDFPELPILHKKFKFIDTAQKHYDNYFEIIQNISRWQDRILVMLWPVIGILSSIIEEEGIENSIYLNFILVEEIEQKLITGIFQIFNREKSVTIGADMNEKNLKQELSEVNDEVIIVDATTCMESAYGKRKAEENVKKIVNKVCKNSTTFGIKRAVNTALVILNTSLIADKKALNVFVTKEFIKDKRKVAEALQNNAMEAFLSSYICFAQEHMRDIRCAIRKYKNEEVEEKKGVLRMAWEIVKMFWESEGFDLAQMVKIPGRIDFDLLYEDIYDSDSLLEVFIQVVRKEICHFFVLEKGQKKVLEKSACFYKNNDLWIPPQILDRMLGRNGLLPQRLQILSELKRKEIIQTDSEGLTRRLQIDGKRFEAFQFKRDFFNKPGWVDIADLGKEEL